MYRICKAFTVESGHMLSKHPARCKYPHGHTRRIELVLASPMLDENDMVCDFEWIKLSVEDYLDRFDHALCVNSNDPMLEALSPDKGRVIVFEEGDPTTERIARRIYDYLNDRIKAGEPRTTADGITYRIRPDVRVQRVRVGETPTCWAEYTE